MHVFFFFFARKSKSQFPTNKMNSRDLAAFLSSLISQLLLLLLILFPSSHPLSLTNSNSSSSNFHETIFPLIHQFLSSSEFATTLSLLAISKKRKRTQLPESDTDSTDEDKDGGDDDQLGTRPGRVERELGMSQNPDSFKLCFKMSSSTFEWLSGLLEPLLECRDPGGSPLNLSAEVRLGVGLYRLASGSDYPEISNRFGVSEFVAKFCVKQLCRVLCTNFRFWVGFPSPDELESVSSGFEALTGLPNCCGVINCARFTIAGHNECNLVEKNDGEHTIAAQIVVDSSSRILSIFAGFRGDKSDWRVLNSSTLYQDIENGSLLNSPPVLVNGVDMNQYLVGDGEYPLLPWLMLPFVDPMPGSCEENFNKSHHLMRLSSLKTIASLKNWGVLSRPIEGEFKTAIAYIGACSILHNVLLMRDDFSAVFDGLGEFSVHDQIQNLEENSIERKASVIRSALATKARKVHNLDDPIDSSGSL